MDFSRLILSSFLFSFVYLCGNAQPHQKKPNPSCRLWYTEAAKQWHEALPLGNGRLGAMVSGGIEEERIQLNEESLWAGAPLDPFPDEPGKYLPQVRQLIFEGKLDEAYKLVEEKLTAKPTSFRSYQTLGDILVDFDNQGPVTDYCRDLDLSSGIADVSYHVNDKIFKRQSFVSAIDNVLVWRITCNKSNSVNIRLKLDREKDVKICTVSDNQINLDGQIIDIPAPEEYDDNPGGSGPGGEHMKFAARLIVKNIGGQITSENNEIVVRNAHQVTFFFTAATDYSLEKMDFDRSIDPAQICEDILAKAQKKSYDSILKDHIQEHGKLFNRVSMDFGSSHSLNIPTDERLLAVKNGGEDNGLIALYFQYGRYLLMSSSRRPGRLPANLQGIWNNNMWAPWESDYHMDINLQMNYWPADLCNLSETMEPLGDFMKKLSEKGRITAERLYNADGWMSHTCTNPFGRTTPCGSTIGSQVVNGIGFPLAGAWMSLTLWRHYEFTQDDEYLYENAYPILKGAAKFVLDNLVEGPNGYLVIAPSGSCENSFINPATGKKMRLTYMTTMDIQLIHALFNACTKASEILDIDKYLSDRLQATLKRIAPMKVAQDGRLQEWIEDYKEAEPGHRHMSHLFALYPGDQINYDKNPKLTEAAKKSLEYRLDYGSGQTGWSRAWVINFYARLCDGDNAYKNILGLLRQSTTTNLFDLHPPDLFQIDGNFGGTAGIAEMLLQSHNEVLRILPALPTTWDKGYITGLKARGDFQVDIYWNHHQLTRLYITSNEGNTCTVRYHNMKKTFETQQGERYVFNKNLELQD